MTLTYSLGGYSFDKTGTYNETDGAKEQNYNLPIYELDRWQKPGDVTDVSRFVLGQAAGPQNSSRYVHSTDHLRVKNLTLGFTLPDQWLTKLGVSKARLYFSGSNLLTWQSGTSMIRKYLFPVKYFVKHLLCVLTVLE